MSKSNLRRCTLCNRKARLESYYNLRSKQIKELEHIVGCNNRLFSQHIDNYSKLDKHTLTDFEWYRSYKNFNGCALCGGDYDIQYIIIRPKYGGKYTINNVIPLCMSCGSIVSMHDNPFISTDYHINSKAYKNMSTRFKEVADMVMKLE